MTTAFPGPAALDDPALFVRQDGVAVFCEHDRKDRSGKVVKRFGKKELERIAANNNARDAAGDPCPLTLGHTIDGAPEAEQPPVVGYARKFRVEWDQKHRKWVIRASYYIRRDKAGEAKEYPRTSVEYWGRGDFLDPIALLKRTPELDLGQWTYHAAHPDRYRYSMEETPVDGTEVDGGATGVPDGGAPDPVEHEKFCRHCHHYMKQHYPHLHAMHAKYAAEVGQSAHPDNGGGAAGLAGQEHPDGFVAGGTAGDDPHKVKMARYEKELEAVKAANADLTLKYRRVERRADLAKLQGEGVLLDIDAELDDVGSLPTDRYEKHLERIRTRYQRDPSAGGFAPVLRGAAPGDGPLTEAQLERAAAYLREKGCGWEEAEKYARGQGR